MKLAFWFYEIFVFFATSCIKGRPLFAFWYRKRGKKGKCPSPHPGLLIPQDLLVFRLSHPRPPMLPFPKTKQDKNIGSVFMISSYVMTQWPIVKSSNELVRIENGFPSFRFGYLQKNAVILNLAKPNWEVFTFKLTSRGQARETLDTLISDRYALSHHGHFHWSYKSLR